MTVVDASIIVTALTSGDQRGQAARRALGDSLAAPSVLRAEFLSALRGELAAGKLGPDAAGRALHRCRELPITLFPTEPFLPRMWELRHNVTPYDAWYVALAEALEVPLLTTDARLARAPGTRCTFTVV